MYPQEVAYCYHSVNVITLSRSQNDHIKQIPLYQLFETKHINRQTEFVAEIKCSMQFFRSIIGQSSPNKSTTSIPTSRGSTPESSVVRPSLSVACWFFIRQGFIHRCGRRTISYLFAGKCQIKLIKTFMPYKFIKNYC